MYHLSVWGVKKRVWIDRSICQEAKSLCETSLFISPGNQKPSWKACSTADFALSVIAKTVSTERKAEKAFPAFGKEGGREKVWK